MLEMILLELYKPFSKMLEMWLLIYKRHIEQISHWSLWTWIIHLFQKFTFMSQLWIIVWNKLDQTE